MINIKIMNNDKVSNKFKISRRNFISETATICATGTIAMPFLISGCSGQTSRKETIEDLTNINSVIECDVLVCGGGPSGFASAISAARNGARVILIERYGFPGGMLTAGFVQPVYGFFSRHIQVVRGIAQELIDELKKIDNATLGHRYRDDCVAKRKKDGECVSGKDEKDCPVACVSNVCAVDAYIARVVIANMLKASKVQSIYHSTVTAIEKEGHLVNKVLISNKSGFQWIKSKIVIDATGDADIAALAGVKYEIGDNGVVKPPSLMFQISGVKHTKDRIKVNLPKIKGETSNAWLMALPGKGNYTVNSPSLVTDFDSTNITKLSEGQVFATDRALNLFTRMKKSIDFLSDISLKSFAPQLGIRDSRRIKGLYTLTDDDVLQCRKFPESGIANGVHPIDLHVKTKNSGSSTLIRLPCGDYYQIPYKTMIPEGIDNLIVTGRTISASFHAQASLRVMATCMMLGEAAGVASSLCVKENNKPEEIDPSLIRKVMISNGAYLGHEDNIPKWNKGLEKLPQNIND
jgi:ribulose 1,5-bisphosphate synthetase/thiazole synthase